MHKKPDLIFIFICTFLNTKKYFLRKSVKRYYYFFQENYITFSKYSEVLNLVLFHFRSIILITGIILLHLLNVLELTIPIVVQNNIIGITFINNCIFAITSSPKNMTYPCAFTIGYIILIKTFKFQILSTIFINIIKNIHGKLCYVKAF